MGHNKLCAGQIREIKGVKNVMAHHTKNKLNEVIRKKKMKFSIQIQILIRYCCTTKNFSMWCIIIYNGPTSRPVSARLK